jgi:hypothetical protein
MEALSQNNASDRIGDDLIELVQKTLPKKK